MGKGQKRKGVKTGSGDCDSFKKFKQGDDTYVEKASVRASIDRDLRKVREAVQEGKDTFPLEEEESGDEEAAKQAENVESKAEEPGEEPEERADPYLLADAKYIQKDTTWRNKQRTLVFCSRGVTASFRRLVEDFKRLLPHHKQEPKFEKRASFHEINEICELKSCNNVVFFEARKRKDLYMWVARVPSGPTLKFQVASVHTTTELRLAGNCLHGSRPVLHFDNNFEKLAELRLLKTLFIQVFGTPRNHPKSKPFHDHVMSFHYMDKKIWFRHFQISPESSFDFKCANDPERQMLTEMGPRFKLDPICFLAGSFSGETMYKNEQYMSPTALRVQAKKLLGNPYVRRLEKIADRKQRLKDAEESDDPLDEAFV